jgi:diaminopropionate ammonia-lyase
MPESDGWYARPEARRWRCPAPSDETLRFHQSLPVYAPTPLTELPSLAAALGVARAFVKDESSRLGLPAFKALGASWAIYRALLQRIDASPGSMTFEGLAEALAEQPSIELVAATDGNHGRAVARFAHLLGLASRIVVPASLNPRAIDAITSEGASVVTVDGSYDDAVAEAASLAAASPQALVIQDTAWPGYEEIPRWIVEGYSTLFAEADKQLAVAQAGPASLVVVPVGVGSLAQAAVTYARSRPEPTPAVLSVEPDTAGGVLASLLHGEIQSVPTAATIMAGLNCGTPSSLAWPILQAGLDAAILVRDDDAARAVHDLAALGISSGPCGAATLAGARAALTGPASPDRRVALGIDERSTVLLISTEGNGIYLGRDA